MMNRKIGLLVLFSTLSVCLGGKLAFTFQTCKRESENFKECLKNAIEDAFTKLDNGIPSLNLPSFQPLEIPSVTIGEGKGVVNVVQYYTNFKVYDALKSTLKSFDVNPTSTSIELKMEVYTPELRFEADYKLNGRVLLLPLSGDGKCTVTLQKLITQFDIYAETFEKKGKAYLKVKEAKVNYKPGKVIYNFENLFNGDERLGAEMNKLLNDNWEDVFKDVKEGFEAAFQTIFGDYANKIFTQVPYDQLF